MYKRQVLIGLFSPAPADGAGPRIPLPTPDPLELVGYCPGVSALVTYTRMYDYIIHQTTAPDGTTTLKITGFASTTVTNEAGKSVSYVISGHRRRCALSERRLTIDSRPIVRAVSTFAPASRPSC